MMRFVAYSGTESMPAAGSASNIYDKCFLEAATESWTWDCQQVADQRTGLLLM